MTENTNEPKPIAVAMIPNEQMFWYKISPLKGRLMLASVVGEQLKSLDRIFKAIDEDLPRNSKSVVCITDIKTEEDGSINFGIAVLERHDDRVQPSKNKRQK